MMQSILVCIVLFVLLLIGLEAGRRLRHHLASRDPAAATGTDAADGVVFAVLGLLIAFTFTSAAGRFDERRALIVEHANALGTAWLRTELLPETDRAAVRAPMRQWLELAIDATRSPGGIDPAAIEDDIRRLADLQAQTWSLAVDAAERHPRPQVATLLLPPINQWIDLSTTRYELYNRRLPPLVMATVIGLAVVSSVLAGFRMATRPRRSLFHHLAFATVITFAIYAIFDLAHPRQGLMRVDAVDHAMITLFESMNASLPGPAPPTPKP